MVGRVGFSARKTNVSKVTKGERRKGTWDPAEKSSDVSWIR